jgi:hypothetical protein
MESIFSYRYSRPVSTSHHGRVFYDFAEKCDGILLARLACYLEAKYFGSRTSFNPLLASLITHQSLVR